MSDDPLPAQVAATLGRLNEALEGRYVFEREIGTGGMSVVYLARDVRHDRHVAVKVLKGDVAEVVGPERFLAEIRTTANLQHPNILPLFDSGEADGFLFYVMPYVEGPTLQQRIDGERQMAIDEAVRITAEVADGLEHAHRLGIIHRDIKPANILLRDGRPLIADFGIALAVGAAGATRLTETGLALGTPFYMSPEQATGDRDIGPASDTYSLASVLYEALTGDPPYLGTTAQSVVSQVVHGRTTSARARRPAIPVNVDHAILKALSKLPVDRFETTSDFRRALMDPEYRYANAPDAAGGSDGVAGGGDGGAGGRGAGGTATSRAGVAAAATIALLAGALVWSLTRPSEPTPPETVHFTLLPRGEGARFVGTGFPGISQDGRRIAFPARVGDTTRIQIRDLDGFGARWIDGTEDGFSPFFSPDGEWLGFFTVSEIRKVPVGGGPATTVASVPFLMEAFAVWLPGDTIVFHHASQPGLQAVHADGGEPWVVTVPDTAAGERRHAVPRPLPDGRVLFQIRFTDAVDDHWNDAHRGAVVSLATGDVVRIEEAGAPWAYLPGDRLLVWNSGAFRALPFDLGRTRATGAGAIVRTDLRGGDSCDYLRVSNSGTAACSDVSSAVTRTVAWFDDAGDATPLPFSADGYRWPRVSPDGTRIAGGSARGLFVAELRSNAVVGLADPPAGNPVWSPDGRAVLYSVPDQRGGAQLWRRDRAAAAPAEPVTSAAGRAYAAGSVSPDGRTLLFHDRSDLWTIPVAGGEMTRLTETARSWERDGAFSPDGRWMAYESDEPGRWEVFVTGWPERSGRTRVSVDGGRSPVWSTDGRRLYFVRGSAMMVADVSTSPQLEVGAPRELFRGGFWVDPSGDPFYDVAPDGRLLMIQGDDEANVRVVTGLVGALVPTPGR